MTNEEALSELVSAVCIHCNGDIKCKDCIIHECRTTLRKALKEVKKDVE